MKDIQSKIGAICINFESLDLLLSAIVSRLVCDDPKIGAIITTELSFSNLVHCFSSLVKYKFSSDQEFIFEVNRLISLCNDCEMKRNQIIHSTYLLNEDEKMLGRLKITAKQKRGLQIKHEIITEDDLTKINAEFRTVIQELESLYFHLFPGETIKYA